MFYYLELTTKHIIKNIESQYDIFYKAITDVFNSARLKTLFEEVDKIHEFKLVTINLI